MPKRLTTQHVGLAAAAMGIVGAGVVPTMSLVAQQGPSGNNKPGGGSTGPTSGTFELKGNVADLAPDLARTISIKIENASATAIKVTQITVKAGAGKNAAGQATCAATFLGLGPAYAPAQASVQPTNLVVTGNGETTYNFPVKLLASATDGCKSVTFPLTYTGTAVKA